MSKDEKELWVLYAFVISSKHQVAIVKSLKEKPLTPTQIRERVRLSSSHISKLLRKLTDKGIIVCLTPEQKKGRLFSLTEIGRWIHNKIE